MKTISVQASRNYSVVIGNGILGQAGSYIKNVKPWQKAAIISDSNVWKFYGEMLQSSLRSADIEVAHFVFHAGEASKNATTYLEILSFLTEKQFTRTDVIIALGGGVVGDITGFAAATYLRGIAYIQIPTSLLAMVDSSVGGKTAIDLPDGKNLVGAFYQPSLVLCDTDVLQTLPADVFVDGCAEVIKYGVLYDAKLFAHLASNGLAFDRETVIARCVELKRNVVCKDEFDTGDRQKLNLGHTIGHSIEAISNYGISHGKAVAIGMAIVSRASHGFGFCDWNVAEQIISVLHEFGLPSSCTYTADTLYQYTLSDKKRTGNSVNLIIPRQIGTCQIHNIPINELQSFIKAGL